MTNKMWGGRFKSGPDAIMQEINASVGFDKRLYAQDIAGSKAHAAMLAQQGIISKSDAKEITRGLDQVQAEIEQGKFTFSAALEDIHMNVEQRLKDIIGEPAGRLRLQPANSQMEPILVNAEDVRIQGVVIGVLRKY